MEAAATNGDPVSPPAPPEPRPHLFTIRGLVVVGSFTLAMVHYPGCTTFGGLKLLVLNITPEKTKQLKVLDPHFFADGPVVARFPPTYGGLFYALAGARGAMPLQTEVETARRALGIEV